MPEATNTGRIEGAPGLNGNGPDRDAIHPIPAHRRLCFLKNIIRNPNIIVGDYTYYDDFEDVANFEKNVKYHFDFVGDKLNIGKFCMIASDVKFIMNGANHLTDAVSAYPFAIFGGGWETAMEDVAPYTIVGGNPAGLIRYRFSPAETGELLRTQWWNWDIRRITRNVGRLTGASARFLEAPRDSAEAG